MTKATTASENSTGGYPNLVGKYAGPRRGNGGDERVAEQRHSRGSAALCVWGLIHQQVVESWRAHPLRCGEG